MTKAEIQLIRSLGDKRDRIDSGLFVVEGEKLVREVLASDFRVRKIYGTSMYSPGLNDEKARKTGVSDENSYEYVTAKEMERVSHLKTPTDCLAVVEIPRHEFDASSVKKGLTLALDEVQNPGNMGTVIRLADWFGITDILCSEGTADCLNPKVVQATMGAITRVRVHYGDLAGMIARLDGPVYGTFLEGESIYEADLAPRGTIVLGSEGHGISAAIERLVTRKLFIPPYPAGRNADSEIMNRPESLNVAIAAAITCSEFRRRQL